MDETLNNQNSGVEESGELKQTNYGMSGVKSFDEH